MERGEDNRVPKTNIVRCGGERTIAFFNCFFAALATALSDVCLPQTNAITSTRNTNNRAYIVAQF